MLLGVLLGLSLFISCNDGYVDDNSSMPTFESNCGIEGMNAYLCDVANAGASITGTLTITPESLDISKIPNSKSNGVISFPGLLPGKQEVNIPVTMVPDGYGEYVFSGCTENDYASIKVKGTYKTSITISEVKTELKNKCLADGNTWMFSSSSYAPIADNNRYLWDYSFRCPTPTGIVELYGDSILNRIMEYTFYESELNDGWSSQHTYSDDSYASFIDLLLYRIFNDIQFNINGSIDIVRSGKIISQEGTFKYYMTDGNTVKVFVNPFKILAFIPVFPINDSAYQELMSLFLSFLSQCDDQCLTFNIDRKVEMYYDSYSKEYKEEFGMRMLLSHQNTQAFVKTFWGYKLLKGFSSTTDDPLAELYPYLFDAIDSNPKMNLQLCCHSHQSNSQIEK